MIHSEGARAPVLAMLVLVVMGSALAQAQTGKRTPPQQESRQPREGAVQAESLPSVEQILARYVEALGGRERLMKYTSRVTRARLEVAKVPGVVGTAHTYEKAPNKAITVIDLLGVGTIVEAFDGKVGWQQNPQTGLRLVTGMELAALKRNTEYYRDLHLSEAYARSVVRSRVTLQGRPAYCVEMVPLNEPPELLYFDAESGLLVRVEVSRLTASGARVAATVTFEDYRTVDGIQFPFRMRQTLPDLELTFYYTEVKHDVDFDDVIFAKPAALR